MTRIYSIGLIAVVLLLAITGVLTPSIADDYANGIVRADKNLIEYINYYYFGWTGRVQNIVLLWIGLASEWSKSIFGILNGLALVALAYASFYLATRRKPSFNWTDRILFSLVFSLLWFLLPVPGETIFWLTGATAYLWPAIFGAGFGMILLSRRPDGANPAHARWAFVFSAVTATSS